MEKQQLEKYINEYGRDIYLLCKRLTQNKNTADDLYQETFLKLWELDNVNDTENPKSYLLGIAVNLWKNPVSKANVAKTDCRDCTGFGRKSD